MVPNIHGISLPQWQEFLCQFGTEFTCRNLMPFDQLAMEDSRFSLPFELSTVLLLLSAKALKLLNTPYAFAF